jgi:hypothetical protein
MFARRLASLARTAVPSVARVSHNQNVMRPIVTSSVLRSARVLQVSAVRGVQARLCVVACLFPHVPRPCVFKVCIRFDMYLTFSFAISISFVFWMMQKGAGAGEMLQFPSKGTKDDLRQWFATFEEGQYLELWDETKPVHRPTPARMLEMSEQSLVTWLGAPTGSIIHNAIHKHDRAATTGTAATGRCFDCVALEGDVVVCVGVCALFAIVVCYDVFCL